MATLKWVHWYNHQRLLGSIGYIPPAEAEANFHRQQAGQAQPDLNETASTIAGAIQYPERPRCLCLLTNQRRIRRSV